MTYEHALWSKSWAQRHSKRQQSLRQPSVGESFGSNAVPVVANPGLLASSNRWRSTKGLCNCFHSAGKDFADREQAVEGCDYATPPSWYFPVKAFQRILNISKNILVPSRSGLIRVPSL